MSAGPSDIPVSISEDLITAYKLGDRLRLIDGIRKLIDWFATIDLEKLADAIRQVLELIGAIMPVTESKDLVDFDIAACVEEACAGNAERTVTALDANSKGLPQIIGLIKLIIELLRRFGWLG